jgi:hypothetical protein
MDNDEAIRLLEQELAPFRGLSYAALVDKIQESPMAYERSVGGASYQIEIEVFCHRPGETIYVIGSVDDGGWRAFSPLTRSFMKSPDETFGDE